MSKGIWTKFHKTASVVALAVFFYASAAAQQPEHRDMEGTFTFAIENDVVSGDDDNYTNGVRIAFLSAENHVPAWIGGSMDKFPLFASEGRRRWGIAFGQNMYTPSDISIPTLQVDDRPYAGWTYASLAMITDTGKRLDNLQLSLGIVGPGAFAGETQDFVHRGLGVQRPQGWHHQLHNEPGIMLTYERKWRGLYEFRPYGLGVDFTPSLGGSIGNVFTYAMAGAVVRVGFDLPSDYGPPLIRPSLSGNDYFVPTRDFGWYLFAGVDGRAVAHNIFLDGNTFRDSHSVDKEPFVGGVQLGVAFTIRDVRLAYTHVYRSQEFKDQRERDEYGALTVSWRF